MLIPIFYVIVNCMATIPRHLRTHDEARKQPGICLRAEFPKISMKGVTMKNAVKYRLNARNIHSLEDFAQINPQPDAVQDVLFVRFLGSCQDYGKRITAIDQKLTEDMLAGRATYLRMKSLPALPPDSSELTQCTLLYDEWIARKNMPFLKKTKSPDLNASIAESLRIVKQLYCAEKKASDSMTKNFCVKIIFWLRWLEDRIFADWKPGKGIKLIAENVLKVQEYLFFYFLTGLGVDVLLAEIRQDIQLSKSLAALSIVTVLGDYADYSLPNQSPAPLAASGRNAAENTASGNSGFGNTPFRSPSSENATYGNVSRANASYGNASYGNASRANASYGNASRANASYGNASRANASYMNPGSEKSFEELARLAASIVMISVHDDSGTRLGTGSGIMIGEGGYILTNYHVASRGRIYAIRIEEDEQTYSSTELIKYNEHLDLAILRIQKRLSPLPIYRGARKLLRGQRVVAIGSPLGLFNSVSDGIISGFRTINDVNMIQFTAPISAGSSGGAVLNMQGELIGISTAGIDSGQNLNLAVSYEQILLFAGSLYTGP